jgi:hypothetical protein
MRRSKNTSHTWSFVFLLNWMLFPIVASFLFSLVFKPIFLPRYLIPSLAPFVLIAAAGLKSLRPVWLKTFAVLLMIVLSGRSVANLYGEGARIDREPWRAVAEYVVGRSRANDGIVFERVFPRTPFEYYFREMYPESKFPKPVWPADPWGKVDDRNPGAWPLLKTGEFPRLWRILLYQSPEFAESRWHPENSETAYCFIQRQSFGFIDVMLYQTCP